MLPAFGFSASDFITAIGLINDFRKALKDSGGSKDDFLLLLQDLEQLQIVLEQLKDGVWGAGGDVGHVNAVRAMALTVQTPLRDFLSKIEKYRCMASVASGVKMRFVSNARKMQWAVTMREDVSRLRAVIATKLLNMSLLLALPAASTVPRLESRLKAIQDSAVETKGLSAKIVDCQNANAQAMRDVEKMSQQNVTDSAATAGQLSRLVEICAGVSIGVKDFGCTLQNHYPRVDQGLERIQELQCQTLTSIPTAIQSITTYVDRIIDILRPLLGVFQEFSVDALELLKRMLQTNLEVHALLLRMQGQMPQTLRMPTHTLFYFRDVLDREHELPYDWFRHWDIFAAMLKLTFRGLPGEEYVFQNRYYLRRSGRDHRRIRQRTWDKNVFPGTKVHMSIPVPGGRDTMSCARCGCSRISENLKQGRADVDPMDVVSLATCPACGLKQYNAQASPKKANRWTDEAEAGTDEAEAATDNYAEQQKIEPGELELFKCVQVEYETLTCDFCTGKSFWGQDRRSNFRRHIQAQHALASAEQGAAQVSAQMIELGYETTEKMLNISLLGRRVKGIEGFTSLAYTWQPFNTLETP